MNSRHLTGHAVDVVVYLGRNISWEWKYYEQIATAFKQAGKELGTAIEWGGVVLLLLVSICLGGYSSLMSHRLVLARQQVTVQQKTLAQQAGLIATMEEQDARNCKLMAEQQQREQQLRQRGEIYQRKYQDAIKNDECACHTAPGAMLDLMRQPSGTTTSADHPVTP
nr:M15 family metallopeptidase [Serratia inhibens]